MCAVSMITDHYRDKWPGPLIQMPALDQRQVEPLFQQMKLITEAEWREYQALKAKAVAYDIATQQPDCVKPGVDEWENDIEAFLILMGWITEVA